MTLYLRLIGRQGNQLFQKFTAHAILKRNPKLTSIEFVDKMPSSVSIHIIEPYCGYFIKELMRDNYFQDSVYMCGYFQDVRYFMETKLDLRSLVITPNMKWVDYSSCVAIHFRRKDYVENLKNRAIYINLFDNTNYYQHAISCMNFLLCAEQTVNYVVFTDDIPWFKKYASRVLFKNNKSYRVHEPSTDTDLISMSTCKHFIISNSTYSMIASLIALNRDLDTCILYPTDWYCKEFKHAVFDLSQFVKLNKNFIRIEI
jgi:hypothetical protein